MAIHWQVKFRSLRAETLYTVNICDDSYTGSPAQRRIADCKPTRLLPCRWSWVYRLMGYRLTLLYDLFFLMRCQGVYMLDGWKQSRGARIERYVADALGMAVIDE